MQNSQRSSKPSLAPPPPAQRAPETQQLQRIRAVEDWLLGLLETSLDELQPLLDAGWDNLPAAHPSVQPLLSALQSAPFANDLERHLGECWCFPQALQRLPNPRRCWSRHNAKTARHGAALLWQAVRLRGGGTCFKLGLERLRWMAWHPNSDAETAEPAWVESAYAEQFAARLDGCPPAQREMRELSLRTELQRELRLYEHPFLTPEPSQLAWCCLELATNAEQARAVLQVIDGRDGATLDRSFKPCAAVDHGECKARQSAARYLQLANQTVTIARAAQRLQVLDAGQLQRLLTLEDEDAAYLHLSIMGTTQEPACAELSAHQDTVRERLYALANSGASTDLRRLARLDDQLPMDVRLRGLCGARFLHAALDLLGRCQARSEPLPLALAVVNAGSEASEQQQRLSSALHLIVGIEALDPDESVDAVLKELRQVDPTLLKVLTRFASEFSRQLLLQVLRLGSGIALWNWLEAQRESTEMDSTQLRALLEQAGDQATAVLELTAQLGWPKELLARVQIVRSGQQLQAKGALLEPDKKFRGMLARLSQEHIRQYGLFPIRSDADLIERYRYLRQAPKEAAKKFGYERAANVRAAALDGLHNLSRTAGYQDLASLEWAVDARVAAISAPPVQQLELDGYAIAIQVQAHKPTLLVEKAGKSLKSLPPALKKRVELHPLLETLDTFKDQAKRYKPALEQLMVEARTLDTETQAALARSPVARSMLCALVLRDEHQQLGWWLPDSAELEAPDGSRKPVSGALQIAHVRHLLDAGQLVSWQSAVLARAVLQPFKQVFRECYVPTPAEIEAGTESARFADRRLHTHVLGAILTGRLWRIFGSDGDYCAIKSLGAGFQARLDLPEVHHFLSEVPVTPLGTISFSQGKQPVPVSAVPALAFSECMRDLDLVITTAAADGERPSHELIASRAELLQALLPGLRLRNVRIESPHVLITGKRAAYRLHLGTAVIHVQPAGYLCIVPAADLQRSKVHLPFVDEDLRTREVLAKVLYLAHDQKITDPQILGQINGLTDA